MHVEKKRLDVVMELQEIYVQVFGLLFQTVPSLVRKKERVPFARHDLYKKEWKTIGKILAKGFNDTGYFPTMISKSFVQCCFYGDVSNTELNSSFLNYVLRDERMLN